MRAYVIALILGAFLVIAPVWRGTRSTEQVILFISRFVHPLYNRYSGSQIIRSR
jgi:hypothetical protein